jgi:hypothetical protein
MENRLKVRKKVQLQLHNVTVGNVLKRMQQFLPAPKWGDGLWGPGEGVKDSSQLLRVEGDPSGRTLDVEGSPENVDAFVKAARELDRTANETNRRVLR